MINAALDRIGDAIPGFTGFRAIVTRELIDHKVGYVTTPLVIGALMILLITGSLIFGNMPSGHITIEDGGIETTMSSEMVIDELNDMDTANLRFVMRAAATVLSSVLFLVLPLVVFFSLLATLFDDRKDRSYLFWKSMPVSDIREVLTKMVALIFIGPLIFVAIAAAVQIIAMILLSISAILHGWPIVGIMWSNTPLLGLWASMIVNYLVFALWILPITGWLLAVSAFSPKTPLMFAVVPPVAVIIMEKIFFDTHYLGHGIGSRFEEPVRLLGRAARDHAVEFGGHSMGGGFPTAGDGFQVLGQSLASGGFWVGAAVGAGLIATAIWLRRYQT